MIVGISSISMYAQTQIDNNGFEGAWENVAGNEDEPVEWSSLKTADQLTTFAPVVAFQETNNPHTGTYCIRLEVVNALGVDAAGVLTNGRVHADFNPDNGYVWTETGDTQWHQVFNDRPDSLVVWVKHDPVGGDKSKIEVVLHDNTAQGQLPHDGNTSHWVGKARIDVTIDTANWTRLAMPFTYYNNNTPDYILATLAAGDSTIPVEFTKMWVDDIELIYNPLIVQIDPTAVQNIDTGVNGNTLTVTEVANASVTGAITREWKWTTTSGSGYQSFNPVETGTTYTPNFATAGIYYVICETDFDGQVVQSNEVEIVVSDPGANSVTITPSIAQTLLTDTDGNMLTANENPSAASSREWMWSNTSGSGYASFNPVETGTTYTPNFPAIGMYYIICESDFAGDIQVSNEVLIDVNGSADLGEEGIKFMVFGANGVVNIRFDQFEKVAQFKIYTLEGKEVYQSVITSTVSQHAAGLNEGIYVYQMVIGGEVFTGKIKL